MRKPISLLVGTLFFMASINAQVKLTPSVISSGGGYGVNDNISISWTLGEVAVSRFR